MNAQWLVDRTRLRSLLKLRPNWSIQDFADALGRSRAWVKKWRKRLLQAAPDDDAVLQSYTLICIQPSIEGGSTHVLRMDRPEKPAPFTRLDRLAEIVLSGRYTWGNRPLEGCAACEHQCIRTR
jgi:hypothetical protein